MGMVSTETLSASMPVHYHYLQQQQQQSQGMAMGGSDDCGGGGTHPVFGAYPPHVTASHITQERADDATGVAGRGGGSAGAAGPMYPTWFSPIAPSHFGENAPDDGRGARAGDGDGKAKLQLAREHAFLHDTSLSPRSTLLVAHSATPAVTAAAAHDETGADGQQPYGPSSSSSSLLPLHLAGAVLGARSLDDIGSRAGFQQIFQAYSTHLYPLLPIVRISTFFSDLKSRRDARDQDWFAFSLSLAAYTLVQVPCAALGLSPDSAKLMHAKLHATSQLLQSRRYAPLCHFQLALLYCDYIYLSTLGYDSAAKSRLGEGIHLLPGFFMQEERRRAHMSGAEQQRAAMHDGELSKRLFCAFLVADLFNSLLYDEQLFFREEDIGNVTPPAAAEDDAPPLLSQHGSPDGMGSLYGYQIACKFILLCYELTVCWQRDRRRKNATVQSVHEMQERLHVLERRLANILSEVSEAKKGQPPAATDRSSSLLSLKVYHTVLEATARYLLQSYTALIVYTLRACRGAGLDVKIPEESQLVASASAAVVHIFSSLRELPLQLIAACGQPALSAARFLISKLVTKVHADDPLHGAISEFHAQLQHLAGQSQVI
ncbi:hypothetical protein K437DRAFT_260158 [Tilletiaria anomala UBC 951]|uniref:Transcription factor domain-containing protein n=1 Tax=Tilletiaria anomala (strain ATCC 24038 / CBS 436.72 / UBC 951) TaxID=1037660 RepID=A0A066V4G5_TILAU|nr:uncharacterized protein K437DRAFT_260158 [Tilletiaria anomala UBC 951]KDN36321.1 hypothetical protein K437DRAFT_260158 [Tilletiaria anomala UBC 951]